MSFIDPFLQPGMNDPVVSSENEFQWGPIATWQVLGIVLDSTAVDAGSTPTTTLRRGLALGQVTATGKWKQYSGTATDGTQFCQGFLHWGRNLLDPRTGTAGDRQAGLVFFGNVKVGSLFGVDELARRQLQDRFVFDDLRCCFGDPKQIVAKTANYQVVNGQDNDIWFVTDGNAAPITFTLPAVIQKGAVYFFYNTVDQNMIVTAAAGKLIAFNNIAATSVALQTAGNKIGGGFMIGTNSDATKYVAMTLGTGTVTVA